MSSLRDTTHTACWGTRRPRPATRSCAKGPRQPPSRAVPSQERKAHASESQRRGVQTKAPAHPASAADAPPHPRHPRSEEWSAKAENVCLTLHPLVCLANGAVVQRGPQSLCFSEQNGASPASSHHPPSSWGPGPTPGGEGGHSLPFSWSPHRLLVPRCPKAPVLGLAPGGGGKRTPRESPCGRAFAMSSFQRGCVDASTRGKWHFFKISSQLPGGGISGANRCSPFTSQIN